MRLKYLEISGFKSFAKKTRLVFDSSITAVVGPNGSGKSNVAEAFRWVLGEQSLKSLRGKRGEDLIFNGGTSASRSGRASVSVAFDNSRREFNLDYDEVVFTRTVHRDGSNEYAINNSQVRLRDIIELLSNVSLGSTGHHIISQGEADRILNSNLKERREMIEEALGLKIYHWKINESEKKLTKTEENIKQVELLRREIAPHIKFLQKQVEKVEKATEMRRQLKDLYFEYFKREEFYLLNTRKDLESKQATPEEELKVVSRELDELQNSLHREEDNSLRDRLDNVEKKRREVNSQRENLSREIGRLEGLIEIKQEQLSENEEPEVKVRLREVEDLAGAVDQKVRVAESSNEINFLKQVLFEVRQTVFDFIKTYKQDVSADNRKAEDLKVSKDKLETLYAQMVSLEEELEVLTVASSQLQNQITEDQEKTIGDERRLYELRARKSQLQSELDVLRAKLDKLAMEEGDFKRELTEAQVLVDHEVTRYAVLGPKIDDFAEPRPAQEDRRRQMERLKIRLEDMGIDGEDVLEEYKEATKRDEFLNNELLDLKEGAIGLRQVMTDLEERLTKEFKEGIVKINKEFDNFFSLMFGGGTAGLKLVSDTRRRKTGELYTDEAGELAVVEEPEEGIDISVSLPRKKVKGLEMLSGGERALTSIALLFAMSQVNPPPFLILDETDAALDEANSRKYGDMIENLSRHSQLILITHNRETMSRAGILYGVTMGSDGISKLLSIKFDQAEGYAK